MPDSTIPTVERLCGHHQTDGFDCGVAYLNESLFFFQRRFSAGERVLGFVAVSAESLTVMGFVILADTLLLVPGTERALRCLTVPAFAVDLSQQRKRVFKVLVEAAMGAMAQRQKSSGGLRYSGILCLPDPATPLERWLRALGFQSVGSEGLMWLPFEETDDDAANEDEST